MNQHHNEINKNIVLLFGIIINVRKYPRDDIYTNTICHPYVIYNSFVVFIKNKNKN